MIRTKTFLKIYFCNYYKTLNVEQDAQINQIKQRFLELAKKHHPDTAEVQSEQFSKIKTAYDTLRDPELRKQYDYQLIHGNPHSRQRSHFYYNSPEYDDGHQMKVQTLNSLCKVGLLILTGYLLSEYFTPMTEHQIRRQNIILSNENIDSSPGVQEKRRKMLMKQMQQKKITSRVIEIKCSNSAVETTKAKNTRKNSIESIPGVKKQKSLIPYTPNQQYM